jgi:hypothetical protein
MHVNQKILELIGLLHAIERLEDDPDDQDELLEMNIQKRDAILVLLSVDQIRESGFLTPDEKKYLLGVKEEL